MKWRKAIGNTRRPNSVGSTSVAWKIVLEISQFASLPDCKFLQSGKLCIDSMPLLCLCCAYSFSPLHETPDIFRHFMKCLTSRIASNIYITYTHLPSRYSNSRNFYFSLSRPWTDIFKTGTAFPGALISMKQPSSDSRILSALISFKRKRRMHLEAVTQDGL